MTVEHRATRKAELTDWFEHHAEGFFPVVA
jgi:hypothetical protein